MSQLTTILSKYHNIVKNNHSETIEIINLIQSDFYRWFKAVENHEYNENDKHSCNLKTYSSNGKERTKPMLQNNKINKVYFIYLALYYTITNNEEEKRLAIKDLYDKLPKKKNVNLTDLIKNQFCKYPDIMIANIDRIIKELDKTLA